MTGIEAARSAALAAADHEVRAVELVAQRVGPAFLGAVEHVAACRGRVVVTGLGKTGHIGAKLAASLSSTGSPAQFVHAAEALHGDLGSLRDDDVLIAISNSGATPEVCAVAALAAERGLPIIAITAEADSALAQCADYVLDSSVPREADPLGLAPTASTTAALVLGDMLASAVMAQTGFTAADFHRSHPGGALGARLAQEAGR
jgi:arabinose-5-phosphate isomerase